MTFRGVSPKKLETLLEHGLSHTELLDFFQSCQKKLMLAGYSKGQRLPHSPAEAVREIVRFSDKTHGVFSRWLLDQDGEGSSELVEQLVPRFQAIDLVGVEFSDKEMRQLCRCGLENLYSGSPSPPWLAYLSADPAANGAGAASELKRESAPDVPEIAEEAVVAWFKWAQGLGDVASFRDPRLELLARLIEAAKTPGPAPSSALAALGDRYPAVKALLSNASAQPTSVPPCGALVTPPGVQPLDRGRDYTQLQLIATRSAKSGNGPFRLEVEAFVDGRTLFTLEDADLRIALPEEGRIILHGEPNKAPPPLGEPLQYRVERFDTRFAIKIRVVEEVEAPIPVFYVPHTSTQPDRVREFILACAKDNRTRNGIFITADGRCLKSRVEPLQRLVAPEFDWTFETWSSLPAVEFRTGAYVVGERPPAEGQYDCAPLSTSARRVLKVLADRKAIRATRQQIAEIVERLREDEDEQLHARRVRIAGKLEELGRAEADYDELISEVMRAPLVREDIEVRKKAAIGEANSDLRKAQKRLETLRQERESIERKLEELKAELNQRVRNVRTEIQRAFETAQANEAATLSNLALWQAIAGKADSTQPPGRVQTESPEPKFRRRPLDPSGEPLSDVFRLAGYADDLARQYSEAVKLMTRMGLPLVVTGPGAFTIGTRIARALATREILCLDVPVGLLSAQSFQDIWVEALSASLLIRDANLSDLGLYAPTLLERLTAGLLDPVAGEKPLIVLTAASGPAGLPWPLEIEHFAAKLTLQNLTNIEEFREESDVGINVVPLQKRLCLRVERAAEEGGIDEAVSSLALRMLRCSVTEA